MFFRTFAVCIKLNSAMSDLSEYEDFLDTQKARLRVEDGAVVCDLGDPFRIPLNELRDEAAVVLCARVLEECVKSHAIRTEEIIKKFVTLANLHNGLTLPVDEVTWEAMLYYSRIDRESST
jgi:hypothetical protein